MSKASLIALVFLGYLAAVYVAVVVTVLLWSLLTSAFTSGTPGTLADELVSVGMMGLMVTFPTALPGFLVVLYLAWKGRWTGWLRYALAGAVDVAPALLLFSLYTGMPSLIPTGLMLVCLPGGFAGGTAYWLVAGKRLGNSA